MLMLITVIVIALIVLWLTGYFGPPIIPEIALPTFTISWTDPVVHALVIIFVIIIVVVLLR
jgi:hypothetical protein